MKKKIFITCCITAILVVWNGIYLKIFPDTTIIEFPLLTYITLGIKEEFLFRYIPFILATCIYIGLKKIGEKYAKLSIIPLGICILAIQLLFSSLHIPLDPVMREVLYGLPPSVTFEELFNIFLLDGILGISLCIVYIIFIPKEKPLSLLQVKSLLATCCVHIIYNEIVVNIY